MPKEFKRPEIEDGMVDAERHDYIRAVKCLAELPATVDKALIPEVFSASTGGGCVWDGPFANFNQTPRCLRRNSGPESGAALSWTNALALLSSPDIATSRREMGLGWHRQSHAFIGRDGVDIFASPNDPAFYLLHAQIHRLRAIWQGQDLETHSYAISGNQTLEGIPLDTAPRTPPSEATLVM
ncbi:hypothetical protein DL770_010151 [Monosporascus sp. CRB-9-2]|nr:hypothetical protein DL770_010151 [Monosporascus sp. CRB-9-2]